MENQERTTPTFTIEEDKIEKERALRYIENGMYFGYPNCCIQHFLNIFSEKGERRNGDVSEYTGFIPCDTHAEQIRKGEATLSSILEDRLCPMEFPFDDEHQDAIYSDNSEFTDYDNEFYDKMANLASILSEDDEVKTLDILIKQMPKVRSNMQYIRDFAKSHLNTPARRYKPYSEEFIKVMQFISTYES